MYNWTYVFLLVAEVSAIISMMGLAMHAAFVAQVACVVTVMVTMATLTRGRSSHEGCSLFQPATP